MKKINYNLLNKSQQGLFEEASTAMETVYNPYSSFYVGSALRSYLKGELPP